MTWWGWLLVAWVPVSAVVGPVIGAAIREGTREHASPTGY